MITALIATHETTHEEKIRAELVVSPHGALTKNRHGKIAPDNNLCCHLTKMTVTDDEVNLHFPDGECCDMGAAIKLATCATPSVLRIQTWSGEKRDTGYIKEGSEWKSLLAY